MRRRTLLDDSNVPGFTPVGSAVVRYRSRFCLFEQMKLCCYFHRSRLRTFPIDTSLGCRLFRLAPLPRLPPTSMEQRGAAAAERRERNTPAQNSRLCDRWSGDDLASWHQHIQICGEWRTLLQRIRRGLNHNNLLAFGMKRKLDDKTSMEDLLEGWTRCQFFLVNKRRLCRMEKVNGTIFCGNHQPLSCEPVASVSETSVPEDGTTRSSRRALKKASRGDRIPCPLDPSHNIYRANLDAHIKICNESKKSMLYSSWPYFCQNCNGGEASEESVDESLIDADQLVEKIQRIYDSIEAHIPRRLEIDDPLAADSSVADIDAQIRNEIGGGQSSFDQLRHVEQDIKIVHHMISAGLLQVKSSFSGDIPVNRDVFLEFGAGKGLLGYAVHFADPSASIGLVERSSNRKKIDKFLTDRQASFERYRMDIRHCYLPKLPLVITAPDAIETRKVAVIAKHLCGVASDMAIRSLCHLEGGPYRKGLALATCCHHACQFDDYVGRDWLVSLGVTRAEFDVFKYWSSWASLDRTAAHRKPVTTDSAGEENGTGAADDEAVASAITENADADGDDHNQSTHTTGREVPRPKNLDYANLAKIGRQIKRMLDYGRLLFLRETLRVSSARMVQYCDEKLSPECILLLATSS